MSTLPAEVTVRALLPEGTRYILPRRNTGDLPSMGLRMFRIGMGVMAVGVVLIVVGIWRVVGELWLAWVFNPLALLGALIAVGSAYFLGVGILIGYGHAEILLDRDFITARELAGLVRWTWRQPVLTVTKLEVMTALSNPQHEPGRDLYRIEARDIFLAPGYPQEWCVALAKALLANWPAEGSDGSANPRPELVLPTPVCHQEDAAIDAGT